MDIGARHPRWSRVYPLIVVWLAVLCRLAYIRTAPPGSQLVNVDACGYHQLAINLLSRGIFSINSEPPFYPDHVRAPLYPLFVAAVYLVTGPAPLAVVLLQALLDAVTVAVILRLGSDVGGRQVGYLTAFLYAISPGSWRFCNELLTEILFGLLLTSALWMLVRYLLGHRQWDMLRFGLLMGAATLCKPNIQFVPLLLLPVLLYKRLRHPLAWWQGTVTAAVTIGVVLLPWLARNRLVFGKWFLTSTFEYNLSLVSAVATLAHARGETIAPWTPRWWLIYEEIYGEAKRRSDGSGCDPSHSICQRDLELHEVTVVANEVIRAHPVDLILSHGKGWLRSFVPQEHAFWYSHLSGQSWDQLGHEGNALGSALATVRRGQVWEALQILIQKRLLALPPLALALWVAWGVGSVLQAVLFGLGLLQVRPRMLALILGATLFYVTFLPGPISYIRFRLPVMPIILLLTAIGVHSLYSACSRRNQAGRARKGLGHRPSGSPSAERSN